MGIKELTINYKNIPIYLLVYENGKEMPSIIFIHGITLHVGVYNNFLNLIGKENLNVVALDLPGHGKSGGRRGEFTYEDLIGSISEVVKFVVKNYNPEVAIFGSSLGGILAFYAAILDPNVKTVICHNVLDLKEIFSFLPFLKRKFLLFNFGKFLVPFFKIFSRFYLPVKFIVNENWLFEDEESIKKWKKDPLCVHKYRVASLMSLFLTPNNKPAITEMKKPVRIIIGERDPIIPLEYIKEFYSKLKCKKDLVIVPEAKHMLPLEFPHLTASLVIGWVKKELKSFKEV